MFEEKTVKIYDEQNKFIGNGYLLSINSVIKVKGPCLPKLKTGAIIIIEIYSLSGIKQYSCTVELASARQLNGKIIKESPVFERRKSLKVPTDISFYIENLHRNGEDVTEHFPSIVINILNLSNGGMLFSSNYELHIGDIVVFNFKYEKNLILLKAKIIRIDKIYDDNTKKPSIQNYGCFFEGMSPYDENIITKYLYFRQLQLYKNR